MCVRRNTGWYLWTQWQSMRSWRNLQLASSPCSDLCCVGMFGGHGGIFFLFFLPSFKLIYWHSSCLLSLGFRFCIFFLIIMRFCIFNLDYFLDAAYSLENEVCSPKVRNFFHPKDQTKNILTSRVSEKINFEVTPRKVSGTRTFHYLDIHV
jgi:hypothetical protein